MSLAERQQQGIATQTVGHFLLVETAGWPLGQLVAMAGQRSGEGPEETNRQDDAAEKRRRTEMTKVGRARQSAGVADEVGGRWRMAMGLGGSSSVADGEVGGRRVAVVQGWRVGGGAGRGRSAASQARSGRRRSGRRRAAGRGDAEVEGGR